MDPKDIQIEGLSAKQRALADIIWACQSREAVHRFIHSLPANDQAQAHVVLEMMMWAVWDNIDGVDNEVVELLDKFRI